MARNQKWITEEEICNQLEADPERFLLAFADEGDLLLREFELESCRMDFVVFTRRRQIRIIEVKLTADASTVDQLARYVNAVSEKFLWWAAQTGSQDQFEISGEIWARWIDGSVWNLARAANYIVSRIQINNEGDVDDVRIEPHPIISARLPVDIEQILTAANTGATWPE